MYTKQINQFIRSINVDGVYISLNESLFIVEIFGIEELRAEKVEEGWFVYDRGKPQLIYDAISDVISSLIILAENYDFFPKDWFKKYSNIFLSLFALDY